jgi:7-cyano-7-deazaguanine synthase
MKKTTCVVSLSGGMDSATALYWARENLCDGDGCQIEAVSFTYGSKHGKYELEAAKNLARAAGVGTHHIVDLCCVFSLVQSDLLLTGGDIPEGHYEDATMRRTVVPGRNLIFASVLAARAETVCATGIVLGVHSGDHAIYPDCRKEFIESLRNTISHSTERSVSIFAPFLVHDKAAILRVGFGMGVPYELTRTCYKDQPLSCGKCGSCQERLEAFKIVEATDPIEYEKEMRDVLCKKDG